MTRLALSVTTALFAVALLSAPPSRAESPSAEQWLERSQEARFPGDSMTADFTLEVVRPDGSKLERKGRSVRATREAKLADRIFVITEPRTIAGMTLLSKDVLGGPANQWLYLPAYKRVRRVAIHGAGDAFVGSDFYYADLARVRVEAGNHSINGEVTVAGRPCVLLETHNDDPLLPYGRTVTSLDKENMLPLRVEYYDRKGVLVKVGTIDAVESHGGYPTPTKLSMRNEVTKSLSRIVLGDVSYDAELDDAMFTVERLEEHGPPQ